jgi:hypothetical protein
MVVILGCFLGFAPREFQYSTATADDEPALSQLSVGDLPSSFTADPQTPAEEKDLPLSTERPQSSI